MSETHVRRRRKRMSEMNVVPYIDVMLVLLIIFMITAPMMNIGVEIDLPVGAAEPLTDRGDPLLVSVTRSGDIFLDTGDSPQLVDGETLATIVGAIVERNPQLQVTVSGDRDVPYQYIFNAMVQLQRAGVPSVGLMGDPEP